MISSRDNVGFKLDTKEAILAEALSMGYMEAYDFIKRYSEAKEELIMHLFNNKIELFIFDKLKD